MFDFFKKMLGNKSQRDIKGISPLVEKAIESWQEIKTLSNDELRARTDAFKSSIKERLSEKEKEIEALREQLNSDEIEIDEELMTKENTILKDGDIYFNDEKLVKFIDYDELEGLRDCLNDAICEAQEDADKGECYRKIRNAFENQIGEFKIKSKSVKNYKGEERNVEKLYIKFNNDFSEVEKFLKEKKINIRLIKRLFEDNILIF